MIIRKYIVKVDGKIYRLKTEIEVKEMLDKLKETWKAKKYYKVYGTTGISGKYVFILPDWTRKYVYVSVSTIKISVKPIRTAPTTTVGEIIKSVKSQPIPPKPVKKISKPTPIETEKPEKKEFLSKLFPQKKGAYAISPEREKELRMQRLKRAILLGGGLLLAIKLLKR